MPKAPLLLILICFSLFSLGCEPEEEVQSCQAENNCLGDGRALETKMTETKLGAVRASAA